MADTIELPVSGPLDIETASKAEFAGWNLGGSLPPLLMIRTWPIEIPAYQRLARELGPDQPLYTMGHPLGDRDEDYPAHIDAWRDFCLARFQQLDLRDPIWIGGWSFGAVVALEVARSLQEAGRDIALVAMFDCRIPKKKARLRRHGLQKLALAVYGYTTLQTKEERSAYLRSGLERRSRKLWKKIRTAPERRRRKRRGAKKGQILVARGRSMERLTRAIRICYLKYQVQPIDVPIAQFWTEESRGRVNGDMTLGWGHSLNGELHILGVSGDHMGMFDEAHVPTLARRLEIALARFRQARPVEPESAGVSAHG